MITRMDGDIGRLVSLLKELKIDENTIVIFTSDNGPHKEGGCRPQILRELRANCAASNATSTKAASACP